MRTVVTLFGGHGPGEATEDCDASEAKAALAAGRRLARAFEAAVARGILRCRLKSYMRLLRWPGRSPVRLADRRQQSKVPVLAVEGKQSPYECARC